MCETILKLLIEVLITIARTTSLLAGFINKIRKCHHVLYFRNCNEMDTSLIRGRRPLTEVNGETGMSENGFFFLEERLMQHQDRRSLVLWRSPLRTLYYFVMESFMLLRKHGMRYKSSFTYYRIV